jgi:hypothetical protein
MAKIDFSDDSIFKTPPAEVNVSELVPQKFETKGILAQFAQHEARINAMARQVADLKIVTDEDNAKATAMGTNASAAVKELTALMNQVIAPYNAFVKTVKGGCKKYTDKIEAEIIRVLKAKQKVYDQEQRIEAEKKRIAFEAEQKAQRERLAAKIAKIEEESGQKIELPPMPEIPPPPVSKPAPVRTARGTSYTKEELVVEIEDEKLIPREYLVPDMSKIKAACKSGKKIPGIRSYMDRNIVYRTA